MVSEGVDVPRLRVGVYATTARTELFFRQVVGRFVRRTPAPREQMSHLFLASDPRLKALAAQVEEERNHALAAGGGGRGGGRAAASAPRRARRSARCGRARAATTTSCARPRPATRCSCSPTPPPRRRPPRWPPSPRPRRAPSRAEGESAHERRERLRDERRALVAAVSRRTGEAHRAIHGRINRETGAPSIAAASVDQLERGNRLLERQTKRR